LRHGRGWLAITPFAAARPLPTGTWQDNPRGGGSRLENINMARVFQDTREKQDKGAKAPWYVEWRQNGRRRSTKIGGKKEAKEFAALKNSERLHRKNGLPVQKSWREFADEYKKTALPTLCVRSAQTAEKYSRVLKQFEQTMKPQLVTEIDVKTMDDYKAERIKSPGRKKGDKLSLATVHGEMSAIFAILATAKKWGYITDVPRTDKPDPNGTDKRYMTAEHFEVIYAACDVAKMPRKFAHRGQQYMPTEWWRALLATAWATGMRIGALLSLRWADANLDTGVLKSLARSNKRKRDMYHQVASTVVRQLMQIRQLVDERIFPWNHDRRTLDHEWHRIQKAAGIHLDCSGTHEHTAACHLYSFHSLRYSHATYNYGRVDKAQLQEQMGHASATMTDHYIKFAEKQTPKPYDAFMPACVTVVSSAQLQKAASG
jgi:integrase